MRRLALILLAFGARLRADRALPQGIHPELAVMEAPQALSGWAQALADLKAGKRLSVSACNIGDSHLQSGIVDGVLRQALQAQYGDAGRGYVFPYEALGTSSPPDTGSVTDAPMHLRRMMGESSGGPVGPGGLAAVCEQPNFVLGFDTRLFSPPTLFDRVRVLYAPGPDRSELWVATRAEASAYVSHLQRSLWRERPVRKGDTLSQIAEDEGCSVADIRRWNGGIRFKLRAGRPLHLWSPLATDAPRFNGFTVWSVLKGDDPRAPQGVSADLGSLGQHVFLLGAQNGDEQKRAEILGLVLEHQDGKGLFWHSLAANGAQAQHYSAQALFPSQVRALAPDLFVLSLGTNETQQDKLDVGQAIAQQRRLWRLLRGAAPRACLLVLTPPDAKWGRHASKRLDPYIAALREAALAEGCAFLDLRAAQGGKGSYARWAAAGYAGDDGVHYKNAGYRLWGQWLLGALQGAEAGHAP